MKQTCILSPARQLTEEEQSLVWQKPPSHIENEAERRIYQEVVTGMVWHYVLFPIDCLMHRKKQNY